MVTRRRLVLLSLFTVLVTLGVGAWLLWPRTAITQEDAVRREASSLSRWSLLVVLQPCPQETHGPRLSLLYFDDDWDDPRLPLLGNKDDEGTFLGYFIQVGPDGSGRYAR
jgi:hypothetical protein